MRTLWLACSSKSEEDDIRVPVTDVRWPSSSSLSGRNPLCGKAAFAGVKEHVYSDENLYKGQLELCTGRLTLILGCALLINTGHFEPVDLVGVNNESTKKRE